MPKDYSKIDAEILLAIQSYAGIPTAHTLSKVGGGPVVLKGETIKSRLTSNPALSDALELHSIEFVIGCDDAVFADNLARHAWVTASGVVLEAIHNRLDEQLLVAISFYEGVPTAFNLSKIRGGNVPQDGATILKRLNANPRLQQALESRGIEFITTCTVETFDLYLNQGRFDKVTGEILEVRNKRIDQRILDAINFHPDIPTAGNLSKYGDNHLPYCNNLILNRLNTNAALQQALESRGINFVSTCSDEAFIQIISKIRVLKLTSPSVYTAVCKRLDAQILDAIINYPGIPTGANLAKKNGGPIHHSTNLIYGRLKENPDLRKALYAKKGLTEDQINVHDAELDNPSPAIVASVQRRLTHTRIFREAIGLLKQFKELFTEKKILQISLYPEPLLRAAEMLGIDIHPSYMRAHGLKNGEFKLDTKIDTDHKYDTIALMQFCHRIGNEALINALNEANKILVDNGALLISIPEEFSRTSRFEDQIKEFGFELQTEGTLIIRTHSLAELSTSGILDAERVKAKVDQATNIFILRKTFDLNGTAVDSFVRTEVKGDNGQFHPSLGEINVPDSINRELSSAFQERVSGMDSGFILEMHADHNPKPDLIGFDVDPKNPLTTEISTNDSSDLGVGALSAVARRLARREFRKDLLVRPGHITKLSIKLVRQALS